MSIWGAAKTTTITSLNAVTTTAVTVDKVITAGYHSASALEAQARNWSEQSQIALAEDAHKRMHYRRREQALDYARRDEELDRALTGNKTLAKYYQRHLDELEQVHRQVQDNIQPIAAQ